MLVLDLKIIGENFYKIRKSKRMTRAEIAERADLSERTYADIERGSVNMRIETVLKICQAMGITPDAVFTNCDSKNEVNLDCLLERLSFCSEKEQETAMRLLDTYLNSVNR